MISVCIPIYEQDVRELVRELARQAEEWDREAELVLIDDASSEEIRELNRPLCQEHRYIELERNHGRARIRNLFPFHSSYQYLLYLDCDAMILSSSFLVDHGKAVLESGVELVCGGNRYPSEPPARDERLSWKYGVERESRSSEERARDPYGGFMGNNFLVHRRLIEELGFDERLRGYGHEDTLFGHRMRERGVKILHIENPVLNPQHEKNRCFLAKTREGLGNLVWIVEMLDHDPSFVQSVRILRVHQRMSRWGLLPFYRAFFLLLGPLLKLSLEKGWVGLRCFDLYKLGCLDSNFQGKG